MKKQLITVGLLLLVTTIHLSGCTETTNNITPPPDNTIEPLTDTDWNYFVWQHLSTDTIIYHLKTITNLMNNITKYIQYIYYRKLWR